MSAAVSAIASNAFMSRSLRNRDSDRYLKRRLPPKATSAGAPGAPGAAVAGALAQDGRPRQSGLRALEGEHLEQQSVIVHRPSPFLIVVADIVGVGTARPPAAAFAGVAGAGRRRGPGFVDHGRLHSS